ncbi:MAG: histidine kinase dimerization/phosphoacceptor domain -containing protein [Pseudomonadota bacterium]
MMAARILICEDDKLQAEQMRRNLTTLGYAVAGVAATLEDAALMCEASAPDLILAGTTCGRTGNWTGSVGSLCARLSIPVIYFYGLGLKGPSESSDTERLYEYSSTPRSLRELSSAVETALYEREVAKAEAKGAEASHRLYSSFPPIRFAADGRGVIDDDGRIVGVFGIAGDITTTEKAVEDLESSCRETAASKRMMEALLNAVTESLFILDNVGTFRALNEATAARLGKTSAELLGRPIGDFLPREIFEPRRRIHDQVIKLAKPIQYEDERMGICFRNSCYPIVGPDGKVELTAFCSTDITQHKRIEKKLREAYQELNDRVEERTRELRTTNERLEQEIAERKHAEIILMAQRDISVALAAISDMDKAFELCLEAVMRISGMEAAGIYIVADDAGVDLVVHKGLSRRLLDAVSHYPKGSPEALRILEGVPVYYCGVLPDMSRSVKEALENEGFRASAAIPISHQGKVICSLNLASRSLSEIPRNTRYAVEDIASRIGATFARIQAESVFRLVYESNMLGMGFCGPSGEVIDANNAYLSMIRRSREDLENQRINWQEITPAEHLPADMNGLAELMAEGRCRPYEKEYKLPDGTLVPVIIGGALLPRSSTTVIAFALDITDRKKAEKQLMASLEEKEILLREIHHRVKNNLAVVSSLLGMQSRHAKDEHHKEMFIESQDRIRSMALVHEKLYQAESLADVDMKEYTRSLVRYLLASKGRMGSAIKFRQDVCSVKVNIETAITLGLIINELVTNSLKHAFPGGRAGRIVVALKLAGEGTLELRVSDDGIGLSRAIEVKSAKTLGLGLVKIFANQLRGRLDVQRDHGTDFILRFNYGG